MTIDVRFDFRSDTPTGLDPDTYSPRLRSYHKLLWSKPLPSGAPFDLTDTTKGAYLHHYSDLLGEFWLASDAVMATFIGWRKMQAIISQMTESENAEFMTLAYTIGGMMVFPGNKIDGKITINGARGFHPRIADRMDLTLECIRRHYLGEQNPLGATLSRHADFFALFDDFHGYVDFFLLTDLVADDYRVRFFMPFDDFRRSHFPPDIDTYREFRRRSIEFIEVRNHRIEHLDLPMVEEGTTQGSEPDQSTWLDESDYWGVDPDSGVLP